MPITDSPRLGLTRWSDPTDPFRRSQIDADNAQLDATVAAYGQGTFNARPAAGLEGRFYYATDTATLYYDTGAAWKSLTGQWADFVPTFAGWANPANPTINRARARRSDGTARVQFYATANNAQIGGAQAMTITLPAGFERHASYSGRAILGTAVATDVSNGQTVLSYAYPGGDNRTVLFRTHGQNETWGPNASFPFLLAAGDLIAFDLEYELA